MEKSGRFYLDQVITLDITKLGQTDIMRFLMCCNGEGTASCIVMSLPNFLPHLNLLVSFIEV